MYNILLSKTLYHPLLVFPLVWYVASPNQAKLDQDIDQFLFYQNDHETFHLFWLKTSFVWETISWIFLLVWQIHKKNKREQIETLLLLWRFLSKKDNKNLGTRVILSHLYWLTWNELFAFATFLIKISNKLNKNQPSATLFRRASIFEIGVRPV